MIWCFAFNSKYFLYRVAEKDWGADFRKLSAGSALVGLTLWLDYMQASSLSLSLTCAHTQHMDACYNLKFKYLNMCIWLHVCKSKIITFFVSWSSSLLLLLLFLMLWLLFNIMGTLHQLLLCLPCLRALLRNNTSPLSLLNFWWHWHNPMMP